jgi:sialate O-acetylesterase
LIGSWRKAWGQGYFPFYFVQLNSNKPTDGTPADGSGFAGIIEGMRRAYSDGEILNIGMATIWDTGNPTNYTPKPGTREGGIMLHCPNKRDVGIRLALWALRDIYEIKDTVVSGPIYKSHKIEGNKIIISFDHVGSGLMAAEKKGFADPVATSGKKLTNFAIAGADQKFHWAEAQIEGNTVVVSSTQVAEPKAVRFCFNSAPFKYFNFYNREGLPASPFITDDWYK